MRFWPLIGAALLAFVAGGEHAAVADASPLPQMGNELREAMDAHEQRLREVGVSRGHCQVGLTFARDGRTILSAGEAARKLGFEVGDALQTLNGEPWAPGDDRAALFARMSKGDRLSVGVLRGEESKTVTGPCPHTSRESRRLLDDLVIVLLRDRPEECLGRLAKLDRQFGASADSLRIRWKCFERASQKGEWKRAEPGEYASAIRDEYVGWIEASSADEEGLAALGPDVAGVISTLTRAGQIGAATAIGGAYREATGEAPPQLADATPRPGATPPPQPGTTPPPPPPPLPGRGSVLNGSCFFVTPDGFVATNAHVIKGKSRIRVIDSAGKVFESKGERVDAANDLALLRVEAAGHAYLSLAPRGAASVGQPIFTMGYPATHILGREPKFTDGVISSLTGLENATNLMQISVPIQPGNSGGPVMNDRGQVVGIATSTAAIEVFLRATGSLPQNVNWAVKSEYLARLVDDAPPGQSAPARPEAIQLTSAAVCRVEAR